MEGSILFQIQILCNIKAFDKLKNVSVLNYDLNYTFKRFKISLFQYNLNYFFWKKYNKLIKHNFSKIKKNLKLQLLDK